MSLARITNNILYQQALGNIQGNLSRLSVLQQQLSTGKQFARPAEDPMGFSAALDLRARLAAQEGYLRNIGTAETGLSLVEASLRSIGDIIARARELAIQAGDAAVAPAQMRMIADEISELFKETLGIANTHDGSGYIFAGNRTNTAPFVLVEGPLGTVVEYVGDDGERLIEIGRGTAVPGRLTGLQAFPGTVSGTAGSATGADLYPNSSSTEHTLGPLAMTEVGEDTSAAQMGISGSAPGDAASDLGIAGTDSANATSEPNLFQTLLDFEAALRSGGDIQPAIDQALRELDAALETNSTNLALVGARLNRLELAANRGQENQLYLTDLLSRNEDIDIAEVMTHFSMQQAVLQAALNATARVIQPSLLDFLS